MNSAAGWGGGERMFLELAVGFHERGHDVSIVCRPGSVLATRLPKESDVHLMGCRGDVDLLTMLALFRLFSQKRFDAVLCNMGRDCVLAGIAAAPFPLPVVQIRAMEHTHRSLRNRFIYRGLLTAVVSVSEPVQAGLATLAIPSHRLHVIHNGIAITPPSIDRNVLRAKFQVAPTDYLVAYTGRLVHEKGIDLLPGVVRHLREESVPVRLLVAGDGPLRPILEQHSAAPELRDHIRVLGFLEDPLPLLAAADAAVMPSRTEAFPVAALETLMVGTPLVAARVGGLVQIAAGDAAALVQPEQPHAFAQALLRIYRDPKWAAELRARGRTRAEHFSRRRMIERYERVLQEMRR